MRQGEDVVLDNAEAGHQYAGVLESRSLLKQSETLK